MHLYGIIHSLMYNKPNKINETKAKGLDILICQVVDELLGFSRALGSKLRCEAFDFVEISLIAMEIVC